MKEISIHELIGRLSSARSNENLTLAVKHDYKCYEMSFNKYDEDKKNEVFHIGYHYDRPRNGIQFSTVCTVKKGKITRINFVLNEKTINLGQLYIDNIKGKNIIATEKPYIYEEKPYESN